MPPPAPIRRAALVGALFALAVFAVLVSGGAPSGLVERGPFSSDFFDAQAHSLLDGRLDVDPAVAGIEGFERDGRTYLYFGVVPAVLRLPVAALTDRFDGRLTQISMLLALAVALSATTQILWRARRWHQGDGEAVRPWEPAVFGSFVAAVGLASPLLFLAARPVVYHEVELWGTATTLVALNALLGWWETPDRRRLALASFTVLVAFNTRASVGGGAVVALALVAALAVLWTRVPWREVPVLALAVLAPILVYGTVNLVRFETPFAVPFEDQVLSDVDAPRQATLAATDNTLFGPEFAPTALATYFRPDGISIQRLFPWATFRESKTLIGDPVFDTVDRAASLPVVAPTLVLLAGVGVIATARRRSRDPWLALTAGAAAGLVSTVTIAFIANRYLADFTPVLVVPAALGLWVVADRLARAGRAVRGAVTVALAGLSVVAMLVSVALTLQSQRLFLLPAIEDRRGFVGLQYDIDEGMRDGPPPAVARVDQIAGPSGRGDMAILGDCTALYWSDGRRWWPLELSRGQGWVLEGALPEGTTTLLGASGWSIVAEATNAEVRIRYERDAGSGQQGESVDLGGQADHRLVVTLDSVNNELLVELDGEEALTAWLVDLSGTVQPDPHWRASSKPAPLCDELATRLDEI